MAVGVAKPSDGSPNRLFMLKIKNDGDSNEHVWTISFVDPQILKDDAEPKI